MKKRIRTIWAGVLCLCPVLALQAGWGDLQEQLRRMVADKKAQVGIAVIVDGRDTLTVNNDVRYPMMSVFKFHQALAVADACGRRGYVGVYPAGRFAPGYVQSVTGQISGRKPVSFRGRAFEVHFAPERQQCLRHPFPGVRRPGCYG